MSSPTLPPSEPTSADDSSSVPQVVVRAGSRIFFGSFESDSNATASNLAGPGRVLGQLFSTAGRRLDAVVERTAARLGLGFEGIARRLFMKLRAPHVGCRAWPEFAKTPVVELAIKLGSERCTGCDQRYMKAVGGTHNREVEGLLLRLVSSIESDLPDNRTAGSLLLIALALSDDVLLTALREPQTVQRVELSLHYCLSLAVQDGAWLEAWQAGHDLQQVLASLMPIEPFSNEMDVEQHALRIWQDLGSNLSVLRTKLRIPPSMSNLIALRIEGIIAAGHDLLQQLYSSRRYMHLDALYVYALSTCPDGNGELAGKLLGSIALLDGHTTPSLLATLHQLPLREVVRLLQVLVDARLLATGSPLVRITDLTIVRLCHDSLREFVVDPRRCRFTQYLGSPVDHHQMLLERCLSLLNEHLCHDICGIRNPGLANKDVPDLPARIARFVNEAVRYACVSWSTHLVGSGFVFAAVSAGLLDFCAEHLLHWLEVLSLLGELSSLGSHVKKVIAWCQDHSVYMPLMQDISRLLSDVYRAFQAYAEPVASHALQVYQSFLATAPGCIWLDHTRRQVITLRLVSYRASDWSSVVKVVEGHTNDVNSIFYSPDGALIVSGSKDNTVRVWDAYTGKQLAVIEHHTDRMESVAFSPDEAQIVLGSDDQMIRVWDPHTGKQLAVLQGDMGVALFVSFSPDGKRITAKDEEGDRLTWNILNSRELTSVKEPITHLPLEAHIWYSESGWIMLSQRSRTHSVRLCWLPNERRGSSFASHNMTAAIGARSGAVTILDFSETIAMLDKVL